MACGDNNPKRELSSQWDMRRGFPVAIHTTQRTVLLFHKIYERKNGAFNYTRKRRHDNLKDLCIPKKGFYFIT